MAQYAVYEGNMERLMKKVTRIQNKCRKFGCDFRFEEVGEEYREIEDQFKCKHIRRFVLVEAEGVAVINDWRFIAAVEHTQKGNIISAACNIEVPERYYTSDTYCEHCHSMRRRKSTFIVMNEKTGEFKQVGKSCLRDFTQGMSVEAVSAYMALFDDIIKAEEPVYGSGYIPRYYPTREFLRYAAECIRKFGYVKRQEDEGFVRTTVSRAIDYHDVDHGRISDSRVRDNLRAEMRNANFDSDAQEVKDMVDAALAWISEQEESSNYIHNLKTACSLEWVTMKHLGLLTSLFPAHNRELERQGRRAKEAQERAKSEWVGSIKDRITVEVKALQCVTSWETEWGVTHIYKFTDANENVFTWKTGKFVPDKVAAIIGTIKDHNEFRGVKQTELTRCKVQ